MKRAWMVLALVAGCEKNKPADTPPAATRPAADAAPTSNAAVVVEPTVIVVDGLRLEDVDGAIPRETLDTLLAARRGQLLIAVAPDATYQRLIDVMDVAVQRGLEPLIDLGGGKTNDPEPDATAPVSDEPILVVTISTDAIMLGQDVVATIADLPPGDDIPALRDAIAKNPRKKLALMADRSTRGDLLIRVIASAKAAGIPDLQFIVKTAPPTRMPAKAGR
jgi:biopolymer transport protein ExbD